MFVVDTNIFITAVCEEADFHEKALAFVRSCLSQNEPWFATWGIFYEFLRVTTHKGVFKKPLSSRQAWDFLDVILSSPKFSFLDETADHPKMIAETINEFSDISGNIWHDAHTVCLMKENGIREVVTADTDFHRFSGIKVMNPFK